MTFSEPKVVNERSNKSSLAGGVEEARGWCKDRLRVALREEYHTWLSDEDLANGPGELIDAKESVAA